MTGILFIRTVPDYKVNTQHFKVFLSTTQTFHEHMF